ncbi:MAG: PDGLE domain-containing protein, partial [Acidimicrobiia bacterium]
STFVAALLSVPASAMAFVILYALGGQGGAPLGALTIAMLGVHVLIGIGEALITTAVVGGLLAYRADLVAGAEDLASGRERTRSERAAVGVGMVIAVLLLVVAPFASANPDGLESVAEELGFDTTAMDSVVADSPVADYTVAALGETGLSVALAGLLGIVITLAVMAAITWYVRGRRTSDA